MATTATTAISFVARGIATILVSGIVLALLVPLLLLRGVTVGQWVVVPVVVITALVIIGPAVLRVARERRERASTVRSR